jgi:hypothetical protein
MTIAVQTSFLGPDRFIGDTRHKLLHLYHRLPEAFKNEKQILLVYWSHYEGLDEILGDRLEVFTDWLIKTATPPNTISRCHRGLKEDGSIPLAPKEKDHRQEQANGWCNYWGEQASQRGEQ